MLGTYAFGQGYLGDSPSGLGPQGQPVTPVPTNPITYRFSLVVSHAGISLPYRPGSIHINDVSAQVQTCEFDVDDKHGSITPSIGSQISITEDMVAIFQGDVDETNLVSQESPYDVNSSGVATGSPVGARVWTVRCIGFSSRAFHILSGSFSAQARVPISLVVETLAANLGVASNVIVSGNPVLPDSFLSDNEYISSALTRLADLATSLSGLVHTWRIAWSGVSFGTVELQFGPPYSTNGYSIGTGGFKPKAKSIHIRTTREEFANTVVLKLDKYLQDGQQVESYDGSAIFLGSLKLTYPCAGAPQITVSGQPTQTVGIKGVDTGKDWYWNTGSNVLTVGGSVVVGGDTITVTYQGLDIRTIRKVDSSSVSSVGRFEVPFQAGDSGSTLSPDDLAQAELVRRDGLTTVVRLILRCPPNIFKTGQSVSVTLPHLTSGSFYLRSLRQFDEEGIIVWRELELINGPGIYTSAQFLSRLTR